MLRRILVRAALPARGRSFAGVAALSLALLAVSGGKTFADTQYSLSTGNAAIAGFPAPYGTVNVHLNSGTEAVITFTAASPAGFVYKFGGAQAIDVNVNGAFTASNFSPASLQPPPVAGNVSTFGNFNFTLDNFDGAGTSSTPMSFTLTKSSGTWASDSAVLTQNASGNFVAAHIFVFGPSGTGDALATGFASGGGTTPLVPEPATIISAAVGLMSMGFFRLRRRRQPADVAA